MEKSNSLKFYLLLIAAVFVIVTGLSVVHAPTPITLLAGGGLTSVIAILFGTKWKEIQKAIFESINSMIIGIMILLLVGCLIGSWILSGVVPALVYYGLILISPSIFLFLACLLCSLMSIFTGTSFGTIGTIGIALMGVAEGLGIPLHYAAAAIITGALFGDKLSPMSDSTIMSSILSGVDNIIDHIKHLLYTTIPPYIISLVLYIFLGINHTSSSASSENTQLILDTLQNSFNLNPILLLVPIITLILIIKKVESIPAFGVSIFLACLFAGIFQGASLLDMGTALYQGFQGGIGVEIVDNMLTRGGMESMLGTVALLISASVFAGPLKAAGVLQFLIDKLTTTTKSWKTLMAGSYVLSIFVVLVLASYHALYSLLGPIMKPLMDKYGVKRKNLSRMLEDTGTAPAFLTPWNPVGVFVVSTLGVPISQYALYTPLAYLGMVFALIYILIEFKPAIGKIETPKEITIPQNYKDKPMEA